MKDLLMGILAFLSILASGFFFYSFQTQPRDAGSMNLILTIVFVLLAIAFGSFFMFKRAHSTEDIHITE